MGARLAGVQTAGGRGRQELGCRGHEIGLVRRGKDEVRPPELVPTGRSPPEVWPPGRAASRGRGQPGTPVETERERERGRGEEK